LTVVAKGYRIQEPKKICRVIQFVRTYLYEGLNPRILGLIVAEWSAYRFKFEFLGLAIPERGIVSLKRKTKTTSSEE